jgi:hypothetical protein
MSGFDGKLIVSGRKSTQLLRVRLKGGSPSGKPTSKKDSPLFRRGQRKISKRKEKLVPAIRRQVVSEILEDPQSDVRAELLSTFECETVTEKLRPAFADLCKVTGAELNDFGLDEFVGLSLSVSQEMLDIRRQLQDSREELMQLDQYRTHTRSLLVMLSQRVADLKKQTGSAGEKRYIRSSAVRNFRRTTTSRSSTQYRGGDLIASAAQTKGSGDVATNKEGRTKRRLCYV